MRRMIAGAFAAVLVAGLVVAPSSARVRQFDGQLVGGGKISFLVDFREGKPKRAGIFKLSRVPVNCDEGDTKVRFSTENVVDVNNRKFHYEFNFSSGTARVDGTIKKSGKRARGKLSYGPSDPSDAHTNCTTDGSPRWRAHR